VCREYNRPSGKIPHYLLQPEHLVLLYRQMFINLHLWQPEQVVAVVVVPIQLVATVVAVVVAVVGLPKAF
jgi:hypothetical protein